MTFMYLITSKWHPVNDGTVFLLGVLDLFALMIVAAILSDTFAS